MRRQEQQDVASIAIVKITNSNVSSEILTSRLKEIPTNLYSKFITWFHWYTITVLKFSASARNFRRTGFQWVRDCFAIDYIYFRGLNSNGTRMTCIPALADDFHTSVMKISWKVQNLRYRGFVIFVIICACFNVKYYFSMKNIARREVNNIQR